MRIFKVQKEEAKHVTHFGSKFLLNPVISSDGEIKTSLITLEAHGIIGFHQTAVPQLMMVLSGEGKVCGENRVYKPVQKGHVVYWGKGEWHETLSETGMTALVVEGPALKENDIHTNFSN
ncbi:cupin domain protein [Jeotgalibacillus alimentarius]|uniref:Cupin domain protein n=1 Tax=Jeotgalibacillus alimentarius TaxID=135826 RepID=A0A0C2VRE7_9BACL|nr:hypothetical protein [Jeotgalibacillus alimentarius]KIL51492.1 cupin domain protein [Jeotgalibacillus alimentarius]